MKSNFIKEFKEFAIKGNMIDIAIGIIIGAAFNGVIDVLVKKVLMPPISLLTSEINFEDIKITLRPAVLEGDKIIKAAVVIEYGTLITSLINFFIIGLCTFFVVKIMNRLRDKAEEPKNKTVKTPKDIELLSDLKNIMEEQNQLLKELKNR
ncbi:MAG TPA: large conductance mechanosensitive channel protein MscL [Flavobacteriaceae bacterium]|nr:large conductance mechanosensitive channel protein MscL [Flavobacteriaceae bacterium]